MGKLPCGADVLLYFSKNKFSQNCATHHIVHRSGVIVPNTIDSSSTGFTDPLTGSATIVPVPVPFYDEDRRTTGIVSGDGTIFVRGLGPIDSHNYAALLRPGTTAWTLARRP
ncbi:hypothetical protein EJB05_36940, partial [Eragrostis curvula]